MEGMSLELVYHTMSLMCLLRPVTWKLIIKDSVHVTSWLDWCRDCEGLCLLICILDVGQLITEEKECHDEPFCQRHPILLDYCVHLENYPVLLRWQGRHVCWCTLLCSSGEIQDGNSCIYPILCQENLFHPARVEKIPPLHPGKSIVSVQCDVLQAFNHLQMRPWMADQVTVVCGRQVQLVCSWHKSVETLCCEWTLKCNFLCCHPLLPCCCLQILCCQDRMFTFRR